MGEIDMIVQANNFGQPWFPLFTSGPNLPVNPNKGHIHVTAETYRFGGVVYSQNEPSDHTKFWCKTTVSNDYAILGQIWQNAADDTDFSRIEFGCSGVYKWDGEQWSVTEAVIWDGNQWNNANDKLGGVTLLLGAYYCEGWPKALDGINAAFVYNDMQGPIGYAHWLANYTQTVPREYAGFEQGMDSYYDAYLSFSGLTCPVEIRGRIDNGESKIANSSAIRRDLTKSGLLYYWQGDKYNGGKAGNEDVTLVYQISCSDTKPQRLTTPGYWIGVKNPTKLLVYPSKPHTAIDGTILMGYGGIRTINYSGLPGGSSIVSLNSCYVWKNSAFVALAKGTQWDFWDGTKWTGG